MKSGKVVEGRGRDGGRRGGLWGVRSNAAAMIVLVFTVYGLPLSIRSFSV